MSGQLHARCGFFLEKKPGTNIRGGWVDVSEDNPQHIPEFQLLIVTTQPRHYID
jgi:hypothetical protein